MLLRVARLHAFLLAPGAHDVTATAGATTVRVIDGVHHLAADTRTATLPPCLARLAPRQELVLLVADHADRRQAAAVNHAHLRRRHAHRRRHGELVAPEIDDAVLPLVTAAAAAHRDVTVIVTTTALLQRLDERLLRLHARDLREIRDGTEP